MTVEAFVGVDIGGTGVRFLSRSDGAVSGESVRSTAELGMGTPATRISRMEQEIRHVVPVGHRLAGVGIGATGPVDLVTGEIDNPDTLPDFSGIGLVPALALALGCPVVIDNDAVTAALGEYSDGAGRASTRLLMITLGTGVGGALLVDGVPWRTGTGSHPELGHLPVFEEGPACYCGLHGCWEPQASRAALQHLLAEVLGAGVPLRELVSTAAARYPDDEAIRATFHRYGDRVGRGIGCLEVALGPTTVVVGGGAATAFTHFEPGIASTRTRGGAYAVSAPVVAAALGERAGAIGAAVLAERGGRLIASTRPGPKQA